MIPNCLMTSLGDNQTHSDVAAPLCWGVFFAQSTAAECRGNIAGRVTREGASQSDVATSHGESPREGAGQSGGRSGDAVGPSRRLTHLRTSP